MSNRLKNAIALSLIPQILLVKWLGNYPEFVEEYYSKGLYPVIAEFWRLLLGWIPFSIGDVLYASLIFIVLRYIIVKRKEIKRNPKNFIRDVIMVISVAYFTFHLLWGMNYYRQPISQALDLPQNYSKNALLSLTTDLIETTNSLHYEITKDSTAMVVLPYTREEVFQKTIQGYEHLKDVFPLLAYKRPSIKTSLFSTPLSYMGYGGYLNPFTHEAQVNGKMPIFRFPMVSGHEAGHQIGYSAENETNFIGYLVTVNNENAYFRYAAYAGALRYCLADIKRANEKTFQKIYKQLNIGVKKNYKEIADFWASYENPLEPVFKTIYSSFLKVNNQKDGIRSYSRVVRLLVAFHQKKTVAAHELEMQHKRLGQ
ncbi:DUF3810 domain-containing protein [Spongiimicrobium salis]|uniref:DUF3810 domain-containing protein n=1 Tax=Spongiimicrobium salis TaxID=1667022 RepID=UPI00374CE1E3